jgi:hypothetical protein
MIKKFYIIEKLVSLLLTHVAMLEVDLYRKKLLSIQMDKNLFFLSPWQKKLFMAITRTFLSKEFLVLIYKKLR